MNGVVCADLAEELQGKIGAIKSVLYGSMEKKESVTVVN
jgi:hypothetical protein